ncbi:MAG: hypothetical protein KBT20_02090 [Bacteroidales bacterium]|nr:hypothetical protein [Candidatus Liminaster caballi]
MEKLERINKYLSDSGVCSRREVDELIETGRVEVNHQPARIGMQIDTENDKVYVDGQLVDPNNKVKNAISIDALIASEEKPWWQEREERRQAQAEAAKFNPKSKLLRHGGLNAAKKTSGKSNAPLTPQQIEEKKALREENRRPKSFAEAVGKLKNPAHDLKERRVEGVNPKAANLRGKKSWSGSSRRTRHK